MTGAPAIYRYIDSPVEALLLVGNGSALSTIGFSSGIRAIKPNPDWVEDHNAYRDAAEQLGQYFAGARHYFDLRLSLTGTPFQQHVWRLLMDIPFGQTRTYGQIAAKLGKPKAARAVGAANGANPLPIVIPCHRLIGANGSLIQFGGGVERKRFLLNLEHPT